MKVDVSAVLKEYGAKIDVGGRVEISEKSLSEAGPTFHDDVSYDGSVANIGRALEFRGKAAGTFDVLCARCNKPLTEKFSFDFAETLVCASEKHSSNNDAAIVFEGREVDLSYIALSNILVNLSLKYLCSEDCKGLCVKCGADLNEGDCGCNHFEIDPRLEGLKKFL